MSNLLSTGAMVTELQTRIPIGLSTSFWGKKLNEAFRWISQKGNFIWDLRTYPFTVAPGGYVWNLPSDCDPGKPMYVAGPYEWSLFGQAIPSLIPYEPWDVTLNQQLAEVVAPPGMFSCFTVLTTFTAGPPPVYSYQGLLYPLSAKPTSATGTGAFNFIYHADVGSTEIAVASNQYFPTPNCFDNLLIELAEAEARRIYGLAGWEIIQKRAETGILNLLDSYRSTKNVLAGLIDQQKQVSEKKLMAQEMA